jgi:hypothetical protein
MSVEDVIRAEGPNNVRNRNKLNKILEYMDLLIIKDNQVMMSNDTYNKFVTKYDLAVPQLKGTEIFITNKGRPVYINPKTLEIMETGTLIIVEDKILKHYYHHNTLGESGDNGCLPTESLIPESLNKIIAHGRGIELMLLDDKKFIHYIPFKFNKSFIHVIVIVDNKITYQNTVETKDENDEIKVEYASPYGLQTTSIKKKGAMQRITCRPGYVVLLYRV